MSDLPKFQYHPYEQTPFDKIPVLEGVIDGLVYFGVVSIQRADSGPKDDPEFAYGKTARLKDIVVGKVQAHTYVIPFTDAFQRVEDEQLAIYLEKRRQALLGSPVTVGKVLTVPLAKSNSAKPDEAKSINPAIKIEGGTIAPPTPAKAPEPVAPRQPVTTAELVLQLATMQADFDLRLRVMAQRLAALEAKQ